MECCTHELVRRRPWSGPVPRLSTVLAARRRGGRSDRRGLPGATGDGVAGLSPVVGLWAALGPLAVYALLGSSWQLSAGPESTTALMTAAALAPLAVGDPGRYAALAAVLALFVGTLCFLAGLVRLGFLADLLSRPVLVGYMAGVAIILIASQLGKLSGVVVKGDEFVAQISSFMGGLDHVHWPTVMLSAVVLVALALLAWRMPRAPGSLIVMLVATAMVSVFTLDHSGIRVVGQVPGGLPVPGVTGIPLTDVVALLVPAGGIAIVAFSDNVLTARTFAARKGQYIDANAELRRSVSAIWAPACFTVFRSVAAAAERRLATRSAAAPSSTR